jgi:tetratricopeptide (TPR) repeat protein
MFHRRSSVIRWTLFLLATASAAQTFNRDVAPIVFRECAPCHRPGEAAPFSLLEYREVKAHAAQIAAVTRSRFMPPWKPEAGKGDFAGVRRLTDEQIRLIARWAENGTPEGDPRDLPPAPSFTEGWQLGAPDLIVTAERPYTLAAAGADVFRNLVFRVPLDRPRYVRALEIRPGNRKVVHHANLLIDREHSCRRREGQDGAAGFPGMDVQIETRGFDPESHFLFWKPGTAAVEEAEDMAWQIAPGTDLILNMHLQPSGKPEAVQPSIGLYFTDKAPSRRPMLVQLEHDGALDIPAGAPAFTVTDMLKLPVAVDVLGVYPHAHYVAKDLQAFATLPDGSRRWLIHIRDWDINWQAVYRYRERIVLPAGTVISMRYTYDNSAGNVRNPSHPPIRVVSGDRSIDEMAHLWLQLLPRDGAQAALQKAVLQRRLQKYPSDFFAEFSLGALLQTEGRLEEAIALYRKALAVRPADATAHNALGSAFLELGDAEGAALEFRAALHSNADSGDAHYNLARVLLSRGDTTEAIVHLRETVRVEPTDASALSDLGAALFLTNNTAEGFRLLHQAVRFAPDHFNARYNLGQALAGAGKSREAAAEFREALRIRPGDPDTVEALKALGGR